MGSQLCFLSDVCRQKPSRRNAQHGQQRLRAFLDEIFIMANLAAGAIMNGIYHISFEVRDILHVLLADKCEALGISQILPKHIL